MEKGHGNPRASKVFEFLNSLISRFVSCFVLRISNLHDFIWGQLKRNRQSLPTPMVRLVWILTISMI